MFTRKLGSELNWKGQKDAAKKAEGVVSCEGWECEGAWNPVAKQVSCKHKVIAKDDINVNGLSHE